MGQRLKQAIRAQKYFDTLTFIYAAFRATTPPLRRRRSIFNQLLTILQLQEMNCPGYAASYVGFGEIQLPCYVAIVQPLTQQAIDRAKRTGFLPKAPHDIPPN
jgi:hypothetical protein